VVDAIKSYNTSVLLEEYRSGSRAWLYDDVSAWLDQRVPAPQLPGEDAGEGSSVRERSSRAFILLAGPGMGKVCGAFQEPAAL
jgi:hypothetical protein